MGGGGGQGNRCIPSVSGRRQHGASAHCCRASLDRSLCLGCNAALLAVLIPLCCSAMPAAQLTYCCGCNDRASCTSLRMVIGRFSVFVFEKHIKLPAAPILIQTFRSRYSAGQAPPDCRRCQRGCQHASPRACARGLPHSPAQWDEGSTLHSRAPFLLSWCRRRVALVCRGGEQVAKSMDLMVSGKLEKGGVQRPFACQV